MPDRIPIPPSDGRDFGAMKFKMASVTEAQVWMAHFPNPLPSTHHIVYHWDDLTLILEVVPKPDAKIAKKGEPSVPDGTGARRAALMAMSLPDLHTLAPQVGVDVRQAKNKPQLVAMIVRAEQKQKNTAQEAAAAS